ncbi:MAG: TetR/AcrR family transcriptional regulator, partial [Gemmatimonadota bacterium]
MAVNVKEMGRPQRSQRETRGDRTRAAIVQAATERFAARGFDATTLADVAADAGVSGPSVAFHFGNKDGLLAAVMDQYFAALLVGVEEAASSPGSPRERLQAFMEF